jgi:Bacterial pre-peptidase C-terminal domain
MKRSMCGLVVLTMAAGLWSCNGDPTSDLQGSEKHVVADPSTVVLGQGAQKFVVVQEVDAQGNQQAVNFTIRNVGPGITVEEDPTYLATTIGTNLETSQRFIVTGNELLNSSFTVETNGDTLLIPVTVAPNDFAATFSTTAPTLNQELTVTAPAGYSFMPGAFVSFGADVVVVTSRAPDGTSFSFVPQPIFPDPTEIPPTPKFRVGTIDSVEAAYIPGVPLTLPTQDSVLIPLLDTVPGHNAPGTAPVIATPAVGGTSAFFDTGGFSGADISGDGGVGAQYYQFTVTETSSYTISLNWPASNLADLDLVLCSDPACNVANFVAAGASHPEAGDYNDLAPGTYYIVAVFFEASTVPPAPPDFPTRIDITITRRS